MAHELARTARGTYAFAFRGLDAWHKEGQRIEATDTLDDIIPKCGFDFHLQRAKVRYAIAHGATPDAYREMPGQVVILRSDDKTPLAVVSDRFKIVQPREIMETFRDLTENAGFQLETAGVLKDGRVYWALARVGADAVIADKRDAVSPFLMLSTACDGSRATEGRFTTVRVVCANTIRMAFGETGLTSVKVSHRSLFDAEAMKDQLGIARENFGAWTQTARQLAHESCNYEEAERFTFGILTAKDWGKVTAEEVKTARETNGFKKILELFEGAAQGSNFAGARGTRWGLLNSVTEYVDHHIRATSDDNRIDSAWFGNGDKLKNRAAELLTA